MHPVRSYTHPGLAPDAADVRAETSLRDGAGRHRIDLARAAGRGDPTALTRLVEVTSPLVWRTCAALVDRVSAEDLTQDTYLRAMRSLGSYRGDSDPTRWLLTIARRVCADEISRRQRARATQFRLQDEHRPERQNAHALVEVTDSYPADERFRVPARRVCP